MNSAEVKTSYVRKMKLYLYIKQTLNKNYVVGMTWEKLKLKPSKP